MNTLKIIEFCATFGSNPSKSETLINQRKILIPKTVQIYAHFSLIWLIFFCFGFGSYKNCFFLILRKFFPREFLPLHCNIGIVFQEGMKLSGFLTNYLGNLNNFTFPRHQRYPLSSIACPLLNFYARLGPLAAFPKKKGKIWKEHFDLRELSRARNDN